MSEKDTKEIFNHMLGLIGEYELKDDKPTLNGFAGFLERRKRYLVNQYNIQEENRKQMMKDNPIMRTK